MLAIALARAVLTTQIVEQAAVRPATALGDTAGMRKPQAAVCACLMRTVSRRNRRAACPARWRSCSLPVMSGVHAAGTMSA